LAALDQDGVPTDAILADYHLDGDTGVDAARALQSNAGRPIPVVIVTADHSPELQRDLKVEGWALMRKPVKAASLRALLSRIIPRRRLAAE
jgi:CheY-like chemotaxis protein